MKIAVVSYGRTGSTKLAHVVSNACQHAYFGEILHTQSSSDAVLSTIQCLEEMSSGTVKSMTFSFAYLPPRSVDWSTFDLVIFCYRQSNVDAFLSFRADVAQDRFIKSRSLDVGVDCWDYFPVSYEQIKERTFE